MSHPRATKLEILEWNLMQARLGIRFDVEVAPGVRFCHFKDQGKWYFMVESDGRMYRLGKCRNELRRLMLRKAIPTIERVFRERIKGRRQALESSDRLLKELRVAVDNCDTYKAKEIHAALERANGG